MRKSNDVTGFTWRGSTNKPSAEWYETMWDEDTAIWMLFVACNLQQIIMGFNIIICNKRQKHTICVMQHSQRVELVQTLWWPEMHRSGLPPYFLSNSGLTESMPRRKKSYQIHKHITSYHTRQKWFNYYTFHIYGVKRTADYFTTGRN